MKNLLLGIIAINLTFISIHLSLKAVPKAEAHTTVQAEMTEIKEGMKEVLNTCRIRGGVRLDCR